MKLNIKFFNSFKNNISVSGSSGESVSTGIPLQGDELDELFKEEDEKAKPNEKKGKKDWK